MYVCISSNGLNKGFLVKKVKKKSDSTTELYCRGVCSGELFTVNGDLRAP